MRQQACRDKLNWIAENCHLSKDTIHEIKKASELCDIHPEFSVLSTSALRPLIREKDTEIKEKTIIKLKERLNGKRGAGRGNTKKINAGEVRKEIYAVKRNIIATTYKNGFTPSTTTKKGNVIYEEVIGKPRYEPILQSIKPDGKNLSIIRDESVDVVISKNLDLSDISDEIIRIIKPSGFLVVFISKYKVGDFFKFSHPGLNQYGFRTSEIGQITNRKNIKYKGSIAGIFQKPPYKKIPVAMPEIMYDHYGDSAGEVLKYLLPQDGVVLDPAIGDGSQLKSDFENSRRCVGFGAHEEIETARELFKPKETWCLSTSIRGDITKGIEGAEGITKTAVIHPFIPVMEWSHSKGIVIDEIDLNYENDPPVPIEIKQGWTRWGDEIEINCRGI